MKEYTLNCVGIESRKEFHSRISQLMNFPDYYGKNLDALFDVLTDICEETLLVIEEDSQLQDQMETYYPRIVKTLKAASRENEYFHFEIRRAEEN